MVDVEVIQVTVPVVDSCCCLPALALAVVLAADDARPPDDESSRQHDAVHAQGAAAGALAQ
jgi:hypothetical protein